MSVFACTAGRLTLRRAARPQASSLTKRSKSSAVEKTSLESAGDATTGRTIPTPDTILQQPLWRRLGPVSKVFNAYGRAQKQRTYATQFCTSLVIYFCGDLSAQAIGGEDYNAWRTVRNVVIGGLCSIPSYNWFMYLERSFNYPSKILSLATKVVINQIAFAPLFISYFFGMQALLSGDTFAEAWERIKRTVPVSFVNSCKLWPAVTAFNFTYVHPQYRALFAGLIAIGWQSYLSWLNQRAADEERAEKCPEALSSEGQAAPTGRDVVVDVNE
ncbi:MAG: mpv17 pmp22 family [Lasallia pustulata]|uniref:Mpv17 pmp22 family n=1 Tax=Lasallia pustulata TaxID=136370 RepID=A0A5M8PYQ9_9LECA|nr:MAG: mpv17 pmp22 family [Lasallia pustulata]